MISVDEALTIIKENISSRIVVKVPTIDALGCVLAEDVLSPIDMPPFPQSAMDGYALNLIEDKMEYEVIGEIKAGDDASDKNLLPGQAVRIFTGAMTPQGTLAIAKQEIVVRNEKRVTLNQHITRGENIRLQGEQINANQVALKKLTVLNPGAIGYLYSLGITEVAIFQSPKISIITTGNELVQAGEKLVPGKVYESNSFTLISALKQYGFDCTTVTIKDDYNSTVNTIRETMEKSDLVLLTGGISVGDYDFVGKALNELNVTSLFYKVKQKPGKPLFFGRKEDTFVFGLPGNPAAVLSCFYIYVLPALYCLSGHHEPPLKKGHFKLKDNYEKTGKLTHFLKARTEDGEVSILKAQSSAMLSSFANADCILRLNEDKETWNAGDMVEVYLMRY